MFFFLPLGALLGRLSELSWGLLGASWAVVERREAETAETLKPFKNLREIDDFCLSGPSGDASRSSLGASWGPLWPSLGCLGPILGHLGAIWAVLGGSSRPPEASWGPLGASCGPLGPSWALQGRSGHSGPQIRADQFSMYIGIHCISTAIHTVRRKQRHRKLP